MTEKITEKKISFWKLFWPSLIAGIVLSIFGWIFWLIVLSSAFSSDEVVKDTDVLRLTLDGAIAERSSTSVNKGTIQIESNIGLSDILYGFEKAKEDPNVKGIYLDLGNISCGYGTAHEIRDAILDFQSSGKFCVAYLHGEVITQKQYYVASAAKKCYGFRTSNMEFVGLGAELTFYKKLFDKVGLEMQIVKGSNNDFKSAVEPLFRENMSDSSRLQVNRYLNSIWGSICKEIADSRNVKASAINAMAENVSVRSVDDAVKNKLMDGAYYQDEMDEKIAKEAGVSSLDKMETFEDYAKRNFKNEQLAISTGEKGKVAVVVAEGGISVNGGEMTSEKICKYFREIRKDDNIKIVVFRVNSPGGSALASEEIWREVSLTAKKKKIIVSMGDVAASGGYYIATPGTRIFAEPTTITGSIGVFGTIPYTGAMLENNLGLSFDRVQTHSHSVLSLNRRLTPEEFALIQAEVDEIYGQFKQRVADGRSLSKKQVEVIARGRVWTGNDALKIGLVDEIGGLTDAIAYAIKLEKLKDPSIVYYPKVKEDAFADLLEELSKSEDLDAAMKTNKVSLMTDEWMQRLEILEQFNGIQMRLPYEITIH